MNFYETDRIIRKQQTFEKSRAYDIIGVLKHKNMSYQEVLACLDVMIFVDGQSETQMQILTKAKEITNYYIEQELIDAANSSNIDVTSIN